MRCGQPADILAIGLIGLRSAAGIE